MGNPTVQSACSKWVKYDKRSRFHAKRRPTDVFMSDDEAGGDESENGSEFAKSGARFGFSAKIKRRRDEGILHNSCNTCM